MEYRDLLDQYNAGINCDNGDIEQLARVIRKLCDNPELRQGFQVYGKNIESGMKLRSIGEKIIIKLYIHYGLGFLKE